MTIEPIHPISRPAAQAILSAGRPDDIPLTLIRLSYHEPDWRWVQDLCIEFSSHRDPWIRRACATAIGHLARIHRTLDKDQVVPLLYKLLKDPEMGDAADDTLDELQIYLQWPRLDRKARS
jgi:hypothetical protein